MSKAKSSAKVNEAKTLDFSFSYNQQKGIVCTVIAKANGSRKAVSELIKWGPGQLPSYKTLYYTISGSVPGFSNEKVVWAVTQAFAIWAPYTPIAFVRRTGAGNVTDIPIRFRKDNRTQLANALIEVNTSFTFFIDNNSISASYGPFDLIAVIAHEIGHHVFRSPSGEWPEHATSGVNIMNPSFGERQIIRQPSNQDIKFCQRRYGVAPEGSMISALLSNAIRLDNGTATNFRPSNTLITIAATAKTSCTFEVKIDNIKGKKVNAVDIAGRTSMGEVLFKRVEIWDGNTQLESQFPLFKIRRAVKKFKTGISTKKVCRSNNLKVIIEVEFSAKRTLSILSVQAETIPAELVLNS